MTRSVAIAPAQPLTAREARTRLGLTAEQLGKRIRVTAAYVRLCERVGCPCFSMAERLSAALGCEMKLFLPKAPTRRKSPKQANGKPRHR